MLLKKWFLSLLAGVIFLSPLQIFAQSLPGGRFNSITVENKWFANQERVSTQYSQQACLLNDGVYKNQRLYLNVDQDNDGLKDYKYGSSTFHLKDNMLYYGNASTDYRIALITPKGLSLDNGSSTSLGTTVYYYTPSSNSNMFSLFNNGISYPIDSNRAWYRFSKVAPINQPVRAITSEAVLFEQPSNTLNPVDRMVQIAYQLRYATYRSVNNNANSDYQVFPVANMDDFSGIGSTNSWYLNNPIQDNGGFGPSWNNNYQQTDATITTKAINRGPERTHALECINYHLSRCGDGYIDVSGQKPIDTDITQPYPISDSGVNEQCDPGANLSSYVDDVMPNGTFVSPSANYYCTATCTIINNPQSPILVYTKTVRNVTTNSNNGQFVEADSQTAGVVIKTGDAVQYQITINRTGGPVTNTILSDVLPTSGGFILSAYSINGGAQISATSFPTTNITSQLNAGSVVVTLYGSVGSPTATAFVNTATLTDPAYPLGVPTLTPGSNVAWTILDNTPPPTPDVSIKKEVEISLNSNTRQELSTVNSGQTVRFKITYKNISSVNATPTITDSLPTGLTCVSAQYQNGTAIPCVSNGISYNAGVLNPGVEQYIIITATVNSALPTGVTTNTATITLGSIVKSDPAQVQPQSITDFIVTKRILSGVVMPGTIMKYEIGFKNTGNTPITSYTFTDPLQNSTYVAGSSKLNGTISVTPSYVGNILTRGCNAINTALNGQIVCPLQPGASGTIVFDVLVN